jgi:hypothetical protein
MDDKQIDNPIDTRGEIFTRTIILGLIDGLCSYILLYLLLPNERGFAPKLGSIVAISYFSKAIVDYYYPNSFNDIKSTAN